MQDDAKTIVQSLLRSTTDDAVEEAFLDAPHLEWLLVTAVESLPHPVADSSASSDDRGVVTYWVTPVGLFKAVVDVLDQDKTPPLAALGTASLPFPDQVTMAGLEHWVRFVAGGVRDALLTTWSFQYPDAETHLIEGVPVPTRYPSAAEDGAEAFGRSIAGRVGWRLTGSS